MQPTTPIRGERRDDLTPPATPAAPTKPATQTHYDSRDDYDVASVDLDGVPSVPLDYEKLLKYTTQYFTTLDVYNSQYRGRTGSAEFLAEKEHVKALLGALRPYYTEFKRKEYDAFDDVIRQPGQLGGGRRPRRQSATRQPRRRQTKKSRSHKRKTRR